MTRRLSLPRRHVLGGAAALGLTAPAVLRAQGKEPIKIGNAMPLTGSQAGYGNDFIQSMRMAIKDVNDAGGIAGRPAELIALDTQAEPQLGINAVNRFIGVDKLPMFFTAWSPVVKAVAPIANREKVLEINCGANAPEIANLGDYVYTALPLADVDITKLAKYAFATLGKKRAAVLYINNDTGIDAAKIYRDTLHCCRRPGRRVRGLRPQGHRVHRHAAENPSGQSGHGAYPWPDQRCPPGHCANAPARHDSAGVQLLRCL